MTTMPVYVALLRGVNVGGHNKVPMADLRTALDSAGFTRIRTYIQSGNVVFNSAAAKPQALAARVRTEISTTFGLDIATIVIDGAALAQVVSSTPYAAEPDPRRVHVFFLPSELDKASRARVDEISEVAKAKGSRDALTVMGMVMYLHTPDGFGTSDLAKALSTRGAGVHRSGTARSWSTVTALLEMCAT